MLAIDDAITRSSLFSDLYQLGRVLAFRRVRPGCFSPDIGKLPWLALLYCLLAIAFSVALNGKEGGAVVVDGGVLVPFGAVVVVAGLLQWIDRQSDGRLWLVFTLLLLMLPLAGFIAATVWPLLANRDFFASPPFSGPVAWVVGMLPQGVAMLPHVWLAVAGTVFAVRGRHSDDWRRGLYMPLVPLALLAVFTSIDPLALWQIGAAATVEDDDGLTIDEDVFYGQSRLLADSLASLEAGQPGVPEIFFLGVAGSEEGVFMREAIAVEQLFRDRYATVGHSLLLINNPATARRIPFASQESLTQALRRIGERMNGGEDLLFLFLTSHGLADHRFSIRLWPFDFADLTPTVLRKALDDSGIQHRVVVVSACYSGGFVPELADANTLVITAAAVDRSSFGCEDANDLTDFGRAYFAEALRETRSFTDAFERARVAIDGREKAGGFRPSRPQLAGGEALKKQLDWFSRAALPGSEDGDGLPEDETAEPRIGAGPPLRGRAIPSLADVLRADAPLNRRR
ncbi:MAG: C13 family peptidase [Azoarcus sp.]|jgi:hypothetical protein|nr:C13 family peptidase [Azoarcus sp.]